MEAELDEERDRIRKVLNLGYLYSHNQEIKVLYNTQQASEKLGCSRLQVRTLIRKGLLPDSRPRDGSKSKHFSMISASDIAEFLRKHGKLNGMKRIQPDRYVTQQVRFSVKPEPATKHVPKSEADFTVTASNGFSTRVTALESAVRELEKKIDVLLKMWS